MLFFKWRELIDIFFCPYFSLPSRWNSPISIALHAPGTDFIPTVNSIKYLRDCLPESNLVRQFVTFHIYFSSKHVPKIVSGRVVVVVYSFRVCKYCMTSFLCHLQVPKHDKVLTTAYNCTIPPPFANTTSAQLYKAQKKLLYPVNVGRNVARDAAMTHFILASDIELYPNPGLVRKFLEMIARNDDIMKRKNPR